MERAGGPLSPFVLLCGYSSSHFAKQQAREPLREICATHSRVHNCDADLVAEWLLDDDRRSDAGDRSRPS